MPATPADVARGTTDGVVIKAFDTAIRDAHSEARDLLDQELEMFFDNSADGQVLLDEKFALLSRINPPHELVAVEDNLRLGQDIAISPVVPSFRIVDAARGIDVVGRCRAYAYESELDHFSVEIV